MKFKVILIMGENNKPGYSVGETAKLFFHGVDREEMEAVLSIGKAVKAIEKVLSIEEITEEELSSEDISSSDGSEKIDWKEMEQHLAKEVLQFARELANVIKDGQQKQEQQEDSGRTPTSMIPKPSNN